MRQRPLPTLLPEEDIIGDPDDDDDFDPTTPGDLWFRTRGAASRGRGERSVVYSQVVT